MLNAAKCAGVLLGLCMAAALLFLVEQLRRDGIREEAVAGPVLSECDGAIQELVIHYLPESRDIVVKAYSDFLSQLHGEVTVHVVCANSEAFNELAARAGPVSCKLSPVIVRHEMTCWSRDRWLGLAPCRPNKPVTLLAPRGEAGAGLWAQRGGDQRIAGEIAAASGGRVRAQRSLLYFDGGDFAADRQTVFVSPAVISRNLQRTVRSREELLETLSDKLKRRIVLLEEAPEHHVGMYMMPARSRIAVVGDPGLAARSLYGGAKGNRVEEMLASGGGADFGEETQRRFDAVAAQCAEAGYRVIRIPVVPGRDGRTYLTYVNVIQDWRDGRAVVYMPVYRGADVLNDAAAKVWGRLGYTIRRVDCTETFRHFGSLHCLVNVLRRIP